MGWRDTAWFGCSYVAMQVAVAAVVALVLSFGFGTHDSHLTAAAFDRWTRDVTKPLASLAADLGAGLFLLAELRRRRFLEVVGWRRCPVRFVVGGAALGLALSLLWGFLASWLETHGVEPTGQGSMSRMAEGGGLQTLAWTILVVGLAPWIEETLFRGVLYASAGGVVSTVVFVMLHLGEIVHYPVALLPITTMALVALTLRVRSGSLGPAVALHLAYNAVIAWPVLVWACNR